MRLRFTPLYWSRIHSKTQRLQGRLLAVRLSLACDKLLLFIGFFCGACYGRNFTGGIAPRA